MAKKTAIASARISSGNVSLTVRYAELAAADAKKKMTIQATVCPSAVIVPRTNRAPLTASSRPEAT
jgi:hypothetical protein